ncbi:VanZ family protein [Geodermatophilus maliterrae]|uniref:VanZ family protein n=1 Tax=Geodermatophilus maliterrae TaxID=3162531 RepID=A0ABV3XIY9_9ACTN
MAALTLVPEGSGWAWGAPSTEVDWYLTGLTSPATLLQLIGNLVLLAVPAALAVRLWPGMAHPARLAAAALAAGGTIEVLQFLLPLGRVVSPVDALLNAAGAVLAGLLAAAAHRGHVGQHHPAPRGRQSPGAADVVCSGPASQRPDRSAVPSRITRTGRALDERPLAIYR